MLGQTGNRRFAAEAIGVEPRLMDQRREYDKLLDRQWREALAQADRRLSGASGPLDCIGGALNVIKRGAGGRLQLVACGPKRWSRSVDDRFFAALGACGNIAAAARAVGFSVSCIAQRRHKWPDFARRMEEALDEAETIIEFRAAVASGGFFGLDQGGDGDDKVGGCDLHPRSPSPGPFHQGRGDPPFDPDFALRFLKWREEKRRGRVPKGAGAWRRPKALDEVKGSILRKLDALSRHDETNKLAQGWTKDEEGRMIPPGWVREP